MKKISKNEKKCLLFFEKVCIIEFVGPIKDHKKTTYDNGQSLNLKKIKKIKKKY